MARCQVFEFKKGKTCTEKTSEELKTLMMEVNANQETRLSNTQATTASTKKLPKISKSDLEFFADLLGKGLTKTEPFPVKPRSNEDDSDDAEGAAAQPKEEKKKPQTELERYISLLEEGKADPKKYPNLHEDIERLVDQEMYNIRRNFYIMKSAPLIVTRKPDRAAQKIVKLPSTSARKDLAAAVGTQDPTLPTRNLGAIKKKTVQQKEKIVKIDLKLQDSTTGTSSTSVKGQRTSILKGKGDMTDVPTELMIQNVLNEVKQVLETYQKCLQEDKKTQQ